MSPLVLYSSVANYQKNQINSGDIDSGNFKISTKNQRDIEKKVSNT